MKTDLEADKIGWFVFFKWNVVLSSNAKVSTAHYFKGKKALCGKAQNSDMHRAHYSDRKCKKCLKKQAEQAETL